MTNTQSSCFEDDKQNAYKEVFEDILVCSDDELISRYKNKLKNWLDFKKVPETNRDYTLPDRFFIDDFRQELNEHLAFIKELFNNAECLTLSVEGYIIGDEFSYIRYKQYALKGQKKILTYANSNFPIYKNNHIAFFSSGRFLSNTDISDVLYNKFAKLAEKNGYPIQKVEKISDMLMKRINIYARGLYKDKLIEIDISDEKKFIDDLFADNNICLTASQALIIPLERREYLALFSNGRFIVAEEYKNKPLNEKIDNFKKSLHEANIIFEEEYVPLSYIENIYRAAQNFDWYITDLSCAKKYNKHYPKILPSPESYAISDKYFEDGNRCLTEESCDFISDTKKSQFAFFSSGLLLINEQTKHNGAVLNFEVIAKRKWPDINVYKEYVTLDVLRAVYERAERENKSAKDIYLEMLKKRAKQLDDEENIPHHEALEVVAKFAGFENWKDACQISNDLGILYMHKEKERKKYISIIDKMAVQEAKEKGISLAESKEMLAKRWKFASWKHLFNATFKQIEEII